MSKRLLVIHHTPSPHKKEMFRGGLVAGADRSETRVGRRTATRAHLSYERRARGRRLYLLADSANWVT